MISFKKDFSLMASLLIPVAVGINFTGFGIVKLLGLPIFLDSIGTVFISLIAGPWVGDSYCYYNKFDNRKLFS